MRILITNYTRNFLADTGIFETLFRGQFKIVSLYFSKLIKGQRPNSFVLIAKSERWPLFMYDFVLYYFNQSINVAVVLTQALEPMSQGTGFPISHTRGATGLHTGYTGSHPGWRLDLLRLDLLHYCSVIFINWLILASPPHGMVMNFHHSNSSKVPMSICNQHCYFD